MRYGILGSLALTLVTTSALAAPPAAVIGINGLTYQPNQVVVAAGDTVQFAASNTHPLHLSGDSDANNNCTATCLKQFAAPGNYGFYCTNHLQNGMSGTITVVDNPDLIFLDGFESVLFPGE